jgi:hypothetical protein
MSSNIERSPGSIEAVAEAIRRYETVWGRYTGAFDRAFDQCETVRDTHPAALDYQIANVERREASDDLVNALWRAASSFARRGDVLYQIVDGQDWEGERTVHIRRIDLRPHHEGGHVLIIDDTVG